MPGARAPAVQGSGHFALALRLAVAAWLGCALLQLFLYLRPGAYGGPFLLEWQRYFLLALYYDLLGVWLVAAPFLIFWLLRYRRPVGPGSVRVLHITQAAVLTLNLVLTQLDHEVLRFLGIRLGFSFIATYVRTDTISDSLFADVLREDPGGPFLSVILLLAVPALYAWWARRAILGAPLRPGRARLPLALALLAAFLPLAAPANGWRMATSQFRLRKVEPVVIALAVDAATGFQDLGAPADLARLGADYQKRWLSESADKAWRFPDPARPYLRVPTGPAAAPEPPWNIILLQLETMRGIDSGHLNPERRPSPTPYLDSLAGSGRAAVYARALSFGQPSINGVFAAHCSIAPHSRRYITGFVHSPLHCLPEVLRRRGYRAEMFNAGDTDWDGSTLWLNRWYDRLWRFPQAKEHDRPVFRAAARRLRELGRSGRPFLATLVSVSNHTPFRSREPAFDIAGQATPKDRILNTTHYTDDVVRELLEPLRREPWFKRTIVVIYGDHGFNLGEHGARAGEQNLYRESVWVPLLFLGGHPRLPLGISRRPASLLDIAPTLAELLGIRAANPWQGHSLLAEAGGRAFAFVNRDMILAEYGRRSVVVDPRGDRPQLFDRSADWLQRHPIPAGEAEAHRLAKRAKDGARLNDFLLRHGLVWRAASGGEALQAPSRP
jgi:phosphoglycerol transferase MdoB-like AlkP superfamily enzyme